MNFGRILTCMGILTLLGCARREKLESIVENGKVVSEIWTDGKNLEYSSFYPNARLNSRGYILANRNRTGLWEYYHEDGRFKAKGRYEDDYRVGLWSYNFNGRDYTVDWDFFLERPVKIGVPKDWRIIKDSVANMPLLVIDSNGTNFNIYVYRNEGANLDKFAAEKLKESHDAGIVKKVSQKEVEIHRQKALEVVYNILSDDSSFVVLQYYFRFYNDIYVLSFFVRKEQYGNVELTINEIAYSLSLF